MRNLTTRLREIVAREQTLRGQQPGADAGRASSHHLAASGDADGLPVVALAAALGGDVHHADGSRCTVVDRGWDGEDWHGRWRVGSFAPAPAHPIALFDSRLAGRSDWSSRVVFFDLETTGLSGGAGTLPFVTGCGWFEGESFVTRQFVLAGPGGEHAMLDALARVLASATLLVTYNGGSFDLPVMDMRWAFHRRENPAEALPHFDMLPPARRFWRRREPDRLSAFVESRCSLTALERDVLGFHRIGDVAGIEIPSRYFHFLRTGDAGALAGVLEHNRHDLLSLAALMARVLWLAHEGPEMCRDGAEQLAVGQLYDRAGDRARARRAYELAAEDSTREVRAHAFARLAVLHRRERRHEDAAAAWRQVLELGASSADDVTTLERQATEALAIHLEHRRRDPGTARRFAQRLRPHVTGARARDLARRLARLQRKIEDAERRSSAHAAVPLFDEEL
jgi:uncharacterized protein YprB with RNaseH-like and TPR domain